MLHQCRFALLTVLIGLAAACSKAPDKAILGEWREQNGKEVLEFFKDGTVSVNRGAIVGDFTFLDQDRIKLNLTGLAAMAGPQIFTLDVNKTTLALTDHRGKTSVYVRSEAAGKAPAGGAAKQPTPTKAAAAEAPRSDDACRRILRTTCGGGSSYCVSLRSARDSQCQGPCASSVIRSLRKLNITTSDDVVPGGPPAPGCIGWRSDIGGTKEGAACLKKVLGARYGLDTSDSSSHKCSGDGFKYSVVLH